MKRRTFLVLVALVVALTLVGYLAAVGADTAAEHISAMLKGAWEVYNHAW